jgi:muconolactone delta-isomerase
MQFLVVAKPQFQAPPDQLPAMIEAAMEWTDRYANELKEFGTFPGGGGFGIADVPDVETLNQMIVEMPFSPFSTHEIYPIVPGATGLSQLRERVAMLAASM